MRLKLTSTVVLIVSLLLASAAWAEKPVKITFDQSPVVSVSPASNSISVQDNSEIVVKFNVKMKNKTLNPDNFLVRGENSGIIPGKIQLTHRKMTAIFKPDNPFKSGEKVTVTLTSGIMTHFGDQIEPYTWQFTVKSGWRNPVDMEKTYEQTTQDKANSIFSADLNADGFLDIIVPNYNSGSISVYLNNGGGEYPDEAVYEVGAGTWDATAADFDNDGDIDIAATNDRLNNIVVMFNDGTGVFPEPYLSYPAGVRPHPIISTDLNGDHNIDLAISTISSNELIIYVNNGDGTFSFKNKYPDGPAAVGLAEGDVDNDGDIDVFVCDLRPEDSVYAFINNGMGEFEKEFLFEINDGPFHLTTGDLNGDGWLDIATANRYSNSITVAFNDGTGHFPDTVYYDGGHDPYYICNSDIDGDGDFDLITANLISEDIWVYENDGAGGFTFVKSTYSGYGALRIVDVDIDNDGLVELAVANAFVNNFAIFDSPETSSECCKLAGDVNNDGDLTLIDVTTLAAYIYDDGNLPTCLNTADVDANCTVDMRDIIKLLRNILGSGNGPILKCGCAE